MGRRERRVGPQRRDRGRGREVIVDGDAQPGDHAGRGAEPPRQPARERRLLAERQAAGRQIVAAEARTQLVDRRARHRRDRQIGAGVDPMTRDHGGLAAVHRADRGAQLGAERRLPHQRELNVQNDAGRAARRARRRGVNADAALHPDRHGQRGDQPLRQDERGLVADPAARLGALGDHGVGARGERGPGLVDRGDLRDHRAARRREAGDVVERGDDHDLDGVGQRVDARTLGHPHRDRLAAHAEGGQRPPPRRDVAPEIEHTQGTRGAAGGDQSGIRTLERADRDAAPLPAPGACREPTICDASYNHLTSGG